MEKKEIERRKHGCDGCRIQTPTERFDGYCGNYLWLCNKCFKEIISEKQKNNQNGKRNREI